MCVAYTHGGSVVTTAFSLLNTNLYIYIFHQKTFVADEYGKKG